MSLMNDHPENPLLLIRPDSWVNSVCGRFRCHPTIACVLCALSIFGIGLLVSFTFGFQTVYLTTIPVYYGVFGIAWVLACEYWGLPHLPIMLDDARVCFKDEVAFVEITNTALLRLCSVRSALLTSAGVFGLGLVKSPFSFSDACNRLCAMGVLGSFALKTSSGLTSPRLVGSIHHICPSPSPCSGSSPTEI